MKPIPRTKNTAVIRTDFSDERAWESICEAIVRPDPEEGFQAYVEFISDPEYAGLTVDQLLSLNPRTSGHRFLFMVDRVSLTDPEQPVLVVNLSGEPGRTFRVIPAEAWGVENNLSIANMDFEEFADSADPDGTFRGFPEI